MKVNVKLLSVLVFVVVRSDFANCIPVNLSDKPNNGSSTQLTVIESGGSQTLVATPPLIFPKDSNVYKIVENDTALKILQTRAVAEAGDSPDEGQNVQLPAAVGTSRGDGDDESISNNSTQSSSISYDDKEDVDDYSEEDDSDENEDGSIDSEVENVQPEDPNREDGLEERFGNKDNHYPLVIDDTVIEVSAMRQEHVWAILVGAIFVLSLAAYIAMVLYRNRLEQRYGMRQRLVTEDDYYTNNDI